MKTNQPTVSYNSLMFASFIEEGSICISQNSKTPIHRGGCGIYAKMLSDKLDECGIPHKILAFIDTDSKLNAQQFIKSNYKLDYSKKENQVKDDVYNVHVVVQIEKVCIDSHGIYFPNIKKEVTEIQKDMLSEWIDNESAWNSEFDRKEVPNIQADLDTVFSFLKDYKQSVIKDFFIERSRKKFMELADKNPLADLFNILKTLKES